MKRHELDGKKAMELNKSSDDERFLLLAYWELESRKIDLLVVNGRGFTRSSFETKDGRFVRKRFTDYMPWAYHSDIMRSLANLNI